MESELSLPSPFDFTRTRSELHAMLGSTVQVTISGPPGESIVTLRGRLSSASGPGTDSSPKHLLFFVGEIGAATADGNTFFVLNERQFQGGETVVDGIRYLSGGCIVRVEALA